MNFSYETQGAVTYLVCELDADEQLDSLTMGMLTNNHIVGLAPVLYMEMNGAIPFVVGADELPDAANVKGVKNFDKYEK